MLELDEGVEFTLAVTGAKGPEAVASAVALVVARVVGAAFTEDRWCDVAQEDSKSGQRATHDQEVGLNHAGDAISLRSIGFRVLAPQQDYLHPNTAPR